MKARGAEFLRTWIEKNVTPGDKGETRAAILATECILEASSQRILVAHMEESGRSVEALILEAMNQMEAAGATES